MSDILLTASEVAERLRVNVETSYLLIQKDNLPAAKIGRQWRFAEAEVTHWVSTKMRGTSSTVQATAK